MRSLNFVKSAVVLLVIGLIGETSNTNVFATPYYWDTNGSIAGSGGPSPSGTWATNVANWSTDPAGAVGTINYTNSSSRAVFSAGNDATGSFTVNIGSPGNLPTATQEAGFKNVIVNSGNITFNGGALTLNSIAFGAGFEIAPGASITMGTATISRTGTNSAFSYLNGGGTFYTPGFSSWPGGAHYIVVEGGVWDFNTAASVGTNRVMVLSGQLTEAVFQGNGNFSRPLLNGNGGIYWTGGAGGGFAARGGALNVSLTSQLVFGASERIGNGKPFVLGSPTADSLVDYQSTISLGTAAQVIEAWNPNNNAGNVARISGVISSGAGASLTKTGLGTLQLTAANNYSGSTTVSQGTLLANNASGSATSSGPVLVNANATFGGTGAITGTVSNFGTIAPGSFGTESLSIGSLTMQLGSTFEVEIGGNTAGAVVNGYDQLIVNGSVTLNNSTLDVSTLNFAPADYSTFFIMTNDGADTVNGIFNGLANDSVFYADGRNWRIRYNVDALTASFMLGSGNDIAIMALAPIPEPSMLTLLGLGSVVMVSAQRRRRRGNACPEKSDAERA